MSTFSNYIPKALILTAVMAPCIVHGKSTGTQALIKALEKTSCYNARARFTVTMPQLNDDVVYELSLDQRPDSTDSLMRCDYVIDWAMTSRQPAVEGFSAYFNGNHYRFAGERLQEYHVAADPVPFNTRGRDGRSTGVHRTAQFANLLPASLAEELRLMTGNPSYTVTFHPDTVISGHRCIALEAIMKLNGVTAMEATYTFDPKNMMPTGAVLENNPGSISEQTVTVSYTDTKLLSGCPGLTETELIERYPDTFENFRQSNFRIENLPGSRLPGFALLTTTGERYMRRTADGFAVPTVVALLDASHGFTHDMVKSLRGAIDALPYNADLIFAFVDKHVDVIEEIVTRLRPGEHLLMGAGALARDCGSATLPVTILCDTGATVKNVILGYNKDLATDVIQKMALIPVTDTVNEESEKVTLNNNTIATSMETVHFKGTPCHTYGSLPAVGSKAPVFNLTGAGLEAIKSEDFKGQTIVLNIFPSLDTEVCARSVRRFNQEASSLKDTKVICVSEDLPFAMSRFCTTEGLDNVVAASAFRSPAFGEKYGVMLVDGPLAGLLTRAVVIIGPDGTVMYRELVPEITHEPDYEAALRVLKDK